MTKAKQRLVLMLTGAAVLAAPAARADVVEATPGGFEVKTVVTIAASRAKLYDALVHAVGRWWDPAHTYSGDSRNLSIDSRPGGCFCETLPDQGGVQHGVVVLAIPGKTLRIRGAFGPLQQEGLVGSLTFALADREGGTEVTMTYSVGGYRQGGVQALAPVVDGVLGGQLRRLKGFAETGTPAATPAP